MNRVVLIGNGFDLAHGMATSYKKFIDWYFAEFYKKLKGKSECKDDLFEVRSQGSFLFPDHENINTYQEFNNILKSNNNILASYQEEFVYPKNEDTLFLKILTNYTDHNYRWADIENDYFDELRKLLIKGANKDKVNKLNNELLAIKNKLEDYLNDVVANSDSPSIPTIIKQIYASIFPDEIGISKKNIFKENIEDIINEHISYDVKGNKLIIQKFVQYPYYYHDATSPTEKSDIEAFVKNRLKYSNGRYVLKSIESCYSRDDFGNTAFIETGAFFKPQNVMCLNFNYTATLSKYTYPQDTINIHGQLNDSKNPIIFGYGDEHCEEYRKLEELGNAYISQMKSSKYAMTNNYRKFLEFIESEPYQVVIMGHSCGNTDRTLLRTLFEHENCFSIKPYYKFAESEEEKRKNYSELFMSISRIFSDKAMLRDKVVNFEYCEPLTTEELPQ